MHLQVLFNFPNLDCAKFVPRRALGGEVKGKRGKSEMEANKERKVREALGVGMGGGGGG